MRTEEYRLYVGKPFLKKVVAVLTENDQWKDSVQASGDVM